MKEKKVIIIKYNKMNNVDQVNRLIEGNLSELMIESVFLRNTSGFVKKSSGAE